MRTSTLASLDMSHFTLCSGLEEFDVPMDIEGDVTVVETIQDLRRSQAEIAVIGEVREYLTENRTSMNEVKAMELRIRVLDAVTAGQLRVNPASVIADDSSYNGSGSIQYVDAGLESIPGMIMKTLKYLKDLIKRGIDFLLSYMKSAKPVLARHYSYFDKMLEVLTKSPAQAGLRFEGQVIKMERGLALGLFGSTQKGPARTITGNNVYDHLQGVEYGIRTTGKVVLGDLIDYTNLLSESVVKHYGEYSGRLQSCCSTSGRVPVTLYTDRGKPYIVIPDYSTIGTLTMFGEPKEVLGYYPVNSPRHMIQSIGRSFFDVVGGVKVEPASVSAPVDQEQSINIVKRAAILLNTIDDDIDSDIAKMQALANATIKALEYPKQKADAEYAPDTILALTSLVNMILTTQSWRIKTIGSVCSSIQGYIRACVT